MSSPRRSSGVPLQLVLVFDDRLAPAIAEADSVWGALVETDDPQLKDTFGLLTTWRTLSGCATPSDDGVLPWNRLLSRIIDDTGYLASVSADERGRQAVANVEKFRDQVRTWSKNGVPPLLDYSTVSTDRPRSTPAREKPTSRGMPRGFES